MPVAVHLVEVREVVERRVGRVDDVAPAVVPPVLLQLEALAGAGNELPQARGMRARVRHRVEGALHHRQQRELGRHAALLELLDDVVEVHAAAVEDALQVVGARRVVGHLLAHQVVVEVGHGEALAHALPQVVGLRGAIDLAHPAQRLGDLLALALERRRRLAPRRARRCRQGAWLAEAERAGGVRLEAGQELKARRRCPAAAVQGAQAARWRRPGRGLLLSPPQEGAMSSASYVDFLVDMQIARRHGSSA